MKRLLLALVLLSSPAAALDFVLYGDGQGGDGLGYGFQGGYLSQRTKQHASVPQPDTQPWGRHDNSIPGYRSHARKLSHPFYGHTPLEPRIRYINRERPISDEVQEIRRGGVWRRRVETYR